MTHREPGGVDVWAFTRFGQDFDTSTPPFVSNYECFLNCNRFILSHTSPEDAEWNASDTRVTQVWGIEKAFFAG